MLMLILPPREEAELLMMICLSWLEVAWDEIRVGFLLVLRIGSFATILDWLELTFLEGL